MADAADLVLGNTNGFQGCIPVFFAAIHFINEFNGDVLNGRMLADLAADLDIKTG